MTGFHEIFQSAPQVAHQARELVDSGLRQNLLQKLIESGHPYGLLLSQSNASSANGSSESLINFFFPPEKGPLKVDLKHGPAAGKMLSWGIIYAPSTVLSSAAIGSQEGAKPFLKSSLINSALVNFSYTLIMSSALKEDESSLKAISYAIWAGFKESLNLNNPKFAAGITMTSLSKSSVLESAKKNPDVAQKLHLEGVFQQAFLAPIWLKLFAGENPTQERKRELVVGQNGVGLGTAAVKLATFRGQEPYVIKTPEGEGVAQINPGDPIGHIHLSHQASQLRQLSPMEKVSIMTEDLLGLFSAIDQPIEVELRPQQQEVLARAKEATVIGISHLVRLFSRKTGLPTWKLDVLPELVQRFHQHDSQAVSRAFGGSRKVRPEDVEMMVITPKMRQQLVANYA